MPARPPPPAPTIGHRTHPTPVSVSLSCFWLFAGRVFKSSFAIPNLLTLLDCSGEGIERSPPARTIIIIGFRISVDNHKATMSSGDGKDAGGTAAGGGDGAAAAAAGGGLTKAKSKTSSEAKSGGSSTFLTSVSFSGGAAGDDFRKEIQMRAEELKAAKMSQVMKSFSRMNESVEGLGVNVKKLLRKQEKDFLAAYRAHMYKVQKELQDLRAKVDESELALKKNDKIQQLEKERDWFRREALRLDTFSTTMRKDLDYMKKKLESIEVDRHWLEQQLKAAKKQNKLLRAELDIRLAGPEDDEFEGGLLCTTVLRFSFWILAWNASVSHIPAITLNCDRI